MFCPQCGKQLPDDSSFCSVCGYQTSTPIEALNHFKAKHISSSRKKNIAFFIAIVAVLVVATAVAGLFLLKGNHDKQYIDVVKDGYLGAYSDITVSEILEEELQPSSSGIKIAWSTYEDQKLGRIVAAQCTLQGENLITYYFRLLDKQVFEISSIGSPDISSSDAEEMSTTLNQMYVTHYNKQGMDIEVLTEKLSNVHAAAVLYGASMDYMGNQGELYLKYRSDTAPYSVAEFLGLTESIEIAGSTTGEPSQKYDVTTDYSYYAGDWKTLGSSDVDFVSVTLSLTDGHNPVSYQISCTPWLGDGLEASLSGEGYLENDVLLFNGTDSYNNQVQGEMAIEGDIARIKSEVVHANPSADGWLAFDTVEIGNYSTGHFIDP